MRTGYAYQFVGTDTTWELSHNDEWETVIVSEDPQATIVGQIRIDGSLCDVYSSSEGEIYAQL